MATPKEARTVIDNKDKLEVRKQYLELRQEYARAIEDRNALLALSQRNEVEDGYFEDEDFLKNKQARANELHEELNVLESGSMVPKKLKEVDTFDREFFDEQLNKIRGELMEPIPEEKPEKKLFLRPEELELIENNFPLGLYPKGDKVKYDGDEWEVAGYDGYTGRGILKRQVGSGQTEYTFAERIPLYLENRFTNQELADALKASSKTAEQNGLSPSACIEMSGDDNFDYERAEAEQEARQGEGLTTKFKDWAKKSYKKFKEEVGSLPQDIRDVIDTEREPFKATVKDVQKDLKTIKEKTGRWFEGRRQAMTEARTYMKLANEFRAVTEKVGTESFNAFFKDFENEKDLIKWADSGYDPHMLNDDQYRELYGYLYTELAKQDIELPDDITKKNRTELFDSVFQPGIEEVIKRNTQLHDAIVENVVTELSNALENYQSDTATLEDMEVRLTQFREELNKELTKIREGQVSMDKKKMIQFIRDALDKDYLTGYVYAPLKIFQSRSKEKQPEVGEREVFEI